MPLQHALRADYRVIFDHSLVLRIVVKNLVPEERFELPNLLRVKELLFQTELLGLTDCLVNALHYLSSNF
jgi:hypothetical protein